MTPVKPADNYTLGIDSKPGRFGLPIGTEIGAPVSFGNNTAIREDLLTRVHPLLVEHKGKIVVLEYDIQMQTWMNSPGTPNAVMINAWSLIVITTGALLGPQNYLSYVWTFGESPQVPDDTVLKQAVREVFGRIGLMQTRQLQMQQPPNAGHSPN